MSYTVYQKFPFDGGTNEIWVGDEFADALRVALNVAGDSQLHPLDHNWVAALSKFGRAVAAWNSPHGVGNQIIFIIQEKDE